MPDTRLRNRIGETDLEVFPLNLGGNVFGWTADREESFAVLDSYAAAGGNFIDTADSYMARVPGNFGGESEGIIGDWMASRGNRDEMIIATKVGSHPERKGLAAGNIAAACEDSLRRLKTDHIDLYYAHRDDPETPLEETLDAFNALVKSGKVRYAAGSNYSPERLAEALAVSEREGLTRYAALQPQYNLLERGYEEDLAPLVESTGLSVLPYFSLASGFLTGKYRAEGDGADGPRAGSAGKYLNERGLAVLAALDGISAAHGVSVTAVSLAWLASRPTVAAPIASARNVRQLGELLQSVDLELTPEEVELLNEASQ